MKLIHVGLFMIGCLPLWAAATPPNPLAPSPRGPEGLVRADPGLPIVLRWRQQELTPANTNDPSRYFLVCLYPESGGNCASTALRWMQAAALIQRTAVTRQVTTPPAVVTAYDYTFQIALPPDMLDRTIVWQVGACGSELESSCTFVATRAVLSARNLRAHNISDGASTSQTLWVTGEVANIGLTDSGQFQTRLVVHDAFADQYGRCITDVNAEGVDAEDGRALTSKGEVIDLWSLPRDANGQLDTRPHTIVAIFRSINDVGDAARVHPGLAVGGSATVVEVTADLSAYTLPAAFATQLVILSPPPVDYDASDNAKGECHTIYGK